MIKPKGNEGETNGEERKPTSENDKDITIESVDSKITVKVILATIYIHLFENLDNGQIPWKTTKSDKNFKNPTV